MVAPSIWDDNRKHYKRKVQSYYNRKE
jgi:hypothetical protein